MTDVINRNSYFSYSIYGGPAAMDLLDCLQYGLRSVAAGFFCFITQMGEFCIACGFTFFFHECIITIKIKREVLRYGENFQDRAHKTAQ